MSNFDLEHFRRRRKINLHESKVPPSKFNTFMYDLIKSIYRHQVSAYGNHFEEKLSDRKFISNLFYKTHYVKNRLSLDLVEDEKITIEDLLLKVTKDTSHSVINYILGDIGSGKTALVNYLISEKFDDYVKTGKYWFVRFDVELNFFDWEAPNALELVISKLVDKIHFVLNEYGNILFKQFESIKQFFLRRESMDTYDYLGGLLKILDQQRRMILVIDNLDSLVHHYDRGLFKDNFDEKIEKIRNLSLDFIKKFSPNGNSALSRTNASILLVLRKTTYDWLNSHSSSQMKKMVSNYFNEGDRFMLLPETWETVVKSRNNLLNECANFIEKENYKSSTKKVIDEIDNAIESKKEKVGEAILSIEALTNSQHRSLVGFLGKYVWINMDEREKIKRNDFFKHTHLSEIAYMLGGVRLYSEQYSNFPNIFSNFCKEDSDETHPTYWLKYLILQTLLKFDETKTDISKDEIVEIFNDYGEVLIKSVLSSMSDVSTANLIHVQPTFRDGKTISTSLSLTKRGKHCLDKVFKKFTYFQLIVDDNGMPIPTLVLEKEDSWILDDRTIDYGYIIEPDARKGKIYEKMLEKKTKQVMVFLDILKGSQRAEREKQKNVFKKLKKYNVDIPSVDLIRNGLIKELLKIHGRISLNKRSTLNIKDIISGYNEKSESLSNEIYKIFL